MFRIADGEPLGYDDPPRRGHSIEFRINAEDPARNFLPAPGTITEWNPPSGPGVRLDAGYTAGQTVPQAFDSLIGKLIITGASREQALQRSRRALAEFSVGGMPTVLPFHRAVVDDPAFAGDTFTVHTRWIETEFTAPFAPQDAPATTPDQARERMTVEVGGKRLEVVLPAAAGFPAAARSASSAERSAGSRPARRSRSAGRGQASGDSLVTPMQGTIVKIVAAEGQQVKAGDTVVILEAMKMEQPLTAHKDGTVTGLAVEVGQTVGVDTEICKIKD
jgi:acetyl-CoA/propionyl-CoA carboxylase, biotin carboxylase, biotin carboxyl carrier protein